MCMTDFSLGLYEKSIPDEVPLTGKLQLASDHGYDYLELSIDESDARLARLDYTSQERNTLRTEIQSSPCSIGSICLSGHRRFPLGSEDSRIRERSLDIMRKTLELSAFLGIPIIQLAGYDVYYEPSNERTQDLFLENLQVCSSLAAAYGIILAFETMETPFMNTVGKAMHYVQKVNSPYLQIYPDLGNIVNASLHSKESAVEDLHAGLGHIVAVHIKETLPGIYREVPYGKGHVDFKLLLTTCWNLGVRRYVTEFWHTSAQDWDRQIQESHDFVMREFFADIYP